MTTPAPGTRRVLRSAELLPPPPLQRPLLLGGLVAMGGAAAWAAIVYFAHAEIGLLAWGIGAAIGAVMVRAGAHGTLLAVAAGALALASIASGKHLAFQMIVAEETADFAAELDQAQLDELRGDAAAWVALGDAPTAAQIRDFARDRDFVFTTPEEFARDAGARLRWIDTTKPDLAQWREHESEEITSRASFVDYLKEDFRPVDVLFVLLGVASAFGFVSRATTRLRVEARRVAREQQAEAAAPAAPAAGSAPPPVP